MKKNKKNKINCNEKILKCTFATVAIFVIIFPAMEHIKAGFALDDWTHKFLGFMQLAVLIAYVHRCLELDVIKYAARIINIFRKEK